MLNGFTAANWIARIPAIQDNIGLGEGGLGLALLGSAAGSLVAMPLAGWGVGKVGSKLLTIGTLAALAATLPLLASPTAAGRSFWCCPSSGRRSARATSP